MRSGGKGCEEGRGGRREGGSREGRIRFEVLCKSFQLLAGSVLARGSEHAQLHQVSVREQLGRVWVSAVGGLEGRRGDGWWVCVWGGRRV